MEDYLRRSMERHGESVYRLALCRLRSVPDAEDVCQDVFLRLLQKGDPAWDEERTKAFLLRCAACKPGLFTIRIGFARSDLRKFFYCDLMKQHARYLSAMFVQEIRDQALVHAHFHCRVDGLFQIAAVCA